MPFPLLFAIGTAVGAAAGGALGLRDVVRTIEDRKMREATDEVQRKVWAKVRDADERMQKFRQQMTVDVGVMIALYCLMLASSTRIVVEIFVSWLVVCLFVIAGNLRLRSLFKAVGICLTLLLIPASLAGLLPYIFFSVYEAYGLWVIVRAVISIARESWKWWLLDKIPSYVKLYDFFRELPSNRWDIGDTVEAIYMRTISSEVRDEVNKNVDNMGWIGRLGYDLFGESREDLASEIIDNSEMRTLLAREKIKDSIRKFRTSLIFGVVAGSAFWYSKCISEYNWICLTCCLAH